MNSGSQVICAAAVFAAPNHLPSNTGRSVREDNVVMADREANSQPPGPHVDWPHARLRKHADYQRVYKAGRKQNSPSMSFFFRMRNADELTPAYTGPRVGLTAGRVLGKAVERNRIRRRMREAARVNLDLLPQCADVVLHPRRLVLTMEFARLVREVAKVFSTVSAQSRFRGELGAQV
jgi:ribonuclease P protein component